MNVFPMQEVVQKVLHGSGECAKVDWTLLGLSLPHWSLAFFAGLLLVCGWQVIRK
jgi:disulfide bond formation protein DsbB